MPRDYRVRARIDGKDGVSATFRKAGRNITRFLTSPLRLANRTAGSLRKGLQAVPGITDIVGGVRDVVGAVSGVVTSTADANDLLAKTARRAGVSAQALQEYAYAAQLAGSDQETLYRAVRVFGLSLGQLRAKGGPLQEFLAKVSPDLRKMLLATNGTEQALEVLFEAIAKLPDANRRAALTSAAFGEEGRALTTMVEDGTDALRERRAEFRKYGYAVSEQGLKTSEDFNDELTRMKTSWEGVKASFGTSFIAAALPELRKLTAWFVENKDTVMATARVFAEDMVTGIKDVVGAVPGILSGLGDIGDALKDIVGAAKEAAQWLKDTFETPIRNVKVDALVAAQRQQEYDQALARGASPAEMDAITAKYASKAEFLKGGEQFYRSFLANQARVGRAYGGAVTEQAALDVAAKKILIEFSNAPVGMRVTSPDGVTTKVNRGTRPAAE